MAGTWTTFDSFVAFLSSSSSGAASRRRHRYSATGWVSLQPFDQTVIEFGLDGTCLGVTFTGLKLHFGVLISSSLFVLLSSVLLFWG